MLTLYYHKKHHHRDDFFQFLVKKIFLISLLMIFHDLGMVRLDRKGFRDNLDSFLA